MPHETAFEMATANIRFGRGVTREVGMDLADMGVRRAMVLTDPNLAGLPPVAAVAESLEAERVEFELFDRVRVEPTDASFAEAIAAAQQGGFDAFVAVGGGSVIDTAKAANLYSTYPAELFEYVNASTGLDVFCHAIESYTALPYGQRPRPDRPLARPAYQGSNPISDVWSAEAIRLAAKHLPRAVEDPEDDEARAAMLLAASYAGMGFGNAGVHLPHGMS